MINFHKIGGKPKKMPAGSEHIWLSYPNGLYAADNQGNPRRIATGIRIGSDVPVGTPDEPGLMYYNTENKKNYISNAETWMELATGGIPGSGTGGGGNAGNVLINDAGNYFTSVDVEGALGEIAERFPWYFGASKLKDYTQNVHTLLHSDEKFYTSAATNKPGNVIGWQTQRLASNGKTYGSFVGDNGEFFTRVNNNFTQMASLATVNANIATATNGITSKLGLGVGTGLKTNGKNLLTGQIVSLSDAVVKQLADIDKELVGMGGSFSGLDKKYLKRTGDTMEGQLYIHDLKHRDSVIGFKDRSGGVRFTMYFNKDTDNMGIWNSRLSNAAFRHATLSGTTEVQALSKGPLQLNSKGGSVSINSAQRTFYNVTGGAQTIVDFASRKGGLRVGSADGYTYLETFTSAAKRNVAKNLRISGVEGKTIPLVETMAGMNYSLHSLASGQSLHVGIDPRTEYGNTSVARRTHSYLVFYPQYINSEANAIRNYARVAYNQARGTLEFRSFRKNTSRSSYVDRTNNIALEANRFINTSSEIFKEDIEPLEDGALESVLKTPTYTYKFKDDHNNETHAGFIIERGVPKLAIESNERAIDNYAMTAYLWKAFQEYVEKTDKKILELEKQLS